MKIFNQDTLPLMGGTVCVNKIIINKNTSFQPKAYGFELPPNVTHLPVPKDNEPIGWKAVPTYKALRGTLSQYLGSVISQL